MRLKYIAGLIAGQSPPSEDVELLGDGQPFLQGNAEFGPTHPTPRYECSVPPKQCMPGDILLSVRAPVGAVNIADRAYGIGRGLCAIRPHSVVSGYLRWWLLHSRTELEILATGSTFAAVSTPVIGALDFPVLELTEQRTIADYLDRETARIDTLITEQQRLIELLRERRKAMITHTATYGLDSAPLIDSGNMYLEAVPVHWVISRFSREIEVNGGQVDPRDNPWADMILVAPNHIESGTGRINGRETAQEQAADSGKYLANAGQILYSKIRPALNKVAVAVEDCLTSADMYVMSSRRGDDHRYLMYFMLAHPFHAFATLASQRVKMPKVNREELGEAPFLRPPLDEQRRIVDYLDRETARIDTLIAETERFIELSRERRSALITAAVTGQIDVREMS